MAYALFKKHESLLGTFFIRKNEQTIALMEEWRLRCTFEQPRSGLVFNKLVKEYPHISKYILPPEYCAIYDLMKVKEPVIEHFQASRKARKLKL